ncbi:MAG: hypothetical protein GYB65_08450 [Chloroflexi bacterium]|nr:hypothetical protein [Chloroflexota bacterium]
MRVEIELRTLPRFRVIDYLVQMGGEVSDILSVQGPDWSATIDAIEPDQVGIVQVPRDRLVIEGDERAVERVAAFITQRVRRMRQGG